MFDDLMMKVKEHDTWRGSTCLNLIPSENFTSPAVQMILSSDMGRRYSLPMNKAVHGAMVENAYRGTKYLDEVEEMGVEAAKRIYGAEHATLKPLSGHVSALIALLSVCKRGDLVMTTSAEFGGYDGYMPEYMPSFLGLNVEFLPFDDKFWNLDVERCAEAVLGRRPKAVVVGSSFILFPYQLEKLVKACSEAGAHLLYDASHVLGLMPWNFQDALAEGVDILYGSTHKSLFGPQGGIIMTGDDELFEGIAKNTTWMAVDNAHWNRLGALSQALLEYERYGRDYGAQVVRNTRALARELNERGLPVRFDYLEHTSSHMMLLDLDEIRKARGLTANEMAVKLERSNIITDAVGRLGLCELTRLGVKEGNMGKLAGLILSALKKDVRKDVAKFRKELTLSFCP